MKATDVRPGDEFVQPGPGWSTSYTVERTERDRQTGDVVLSVRHRDGSTASRVFLPEADVPLVRPVMEA